MAYLIVADRDSELDRLEITGPMTIGRAPDCDVSVHDAMLSRHHCVIEPLGDRFVVTDLRSRNGTHISGERIARHVLTDGEVVRIGRTRLCFFQGAYVPNSVVPRWNSRNRPRDPNEALAGTMIGLALSDMEDDWRASGFPIPRPKPADPGAYQGEQVHELVTSMSSGIWDTKLMTEAPPARSRVLPQPRLDREKYVLSIARQRASIPETRERRNSSRPIARRQDPRPDPTPARRWLVHVSVVSAAIICLACALELFLA